MMKMLHSAKYYTCCCFIAFLLLIPHFLGNAYAEDPVSSAGTFQVTDIEWAESRKRIAQKAKSNRFIFSIQFGSRDVRCVYKLLHLPVPAATVECSGTISSIQVLP